MRKSLFIGLVAILGLIGCSRNQEIDVPDANLSLFARTESPADTKTVVESGVHVYWEPGDEIAVFMGDQSAKFTTDITAASGTATFKGTFGDATWPEDLDLWAVYPFSEDAVFDGETITTTLPSEQVAREGSFGKDMNLAIAHSNSSTLQFYNVGGGIRFSVTEEGIKKVIFEGLSGEIISGKVKIGLDENGKPVVQEVTGGSQFITLLPPGGQDTFAQDTWYYIVAIPGTLEGGYKLRFYKDSDYARRVSEKAVQIKRSIFGSLQKADDGIEYESTTMHFPETEEEWEETESDVSTMKASIEAILDNRHLSGEDYPDPISIAAEVAMIEGVISVSPSQDGSILYLQMQNGVYVNVLLDSLEDSFGDSFSYTEDLDEQRISLNAAVSSVPPGNKALVLLPLYDEVISDLGEHAKVLYANIISSLESCGFEVDPYYNSQASINKFRGDNLELYDVVYLNTHGTDQAKLADGTLTTALKTGTPIPSNSDNLGIRWGAIPERCLWIDPGNEDCYWITTEAYKYDRPTLNSSWIFLHACKSLTRNDLSQYFLDRGAAACSGFLTNASKRSSVDFAADLIDAFASGMEVQEASYWAITNSTNQYGEPWSQGGTRDNFCTYRNNELGNFYLFDPKPYELKYDAENKEFRWKVHPHTGEYIYELYVSINGNNTYISTITDNGSTNYTYDISFLAPGSYSWFIETIHHYSNDVIGSFYSDVVRFTVEEEPISYEIPKAIDFGLPSGTKWASFNLGATKPEEYGYYYAWGETEPKASYSWSNYKWCKGTDHSLTKYCTDSSFGYNGFVDDKTRIELSDDAARFNLGSSFRTPTCDEWKELFENSSIEWTNSYYGTGVTGYILTSKVPGYTNNSVFLPSAGYFWGYQGHVGDYMTSESIDCLPTGFDTMYFSSDGIYGCGYLHLSSVGAKDEGTTIRPVHPTQVKQITIVPTQTSGYVGNQIVLSTETVPLNASHNYIWSSSNESIAKVFSSRDNTCRINLVSPGVATITVTALDGNVSASCQVIVKEEEPKAKISISPTEINYGDVKVGHGLGNETGRVTFTNTGNADLSIFSIDCPDGFSHSTAYTFPIVISPGNDKTIVFAFRPTEVKTYSGYIQVYTNASNGGGTIKVTGNGIE